MKKFWGAIAAVGAAALLFAGCAGIKNATDTIPAEAAEDVEGMSADALIEDIQGTLTYMGGLHVNDDSDADMKLAIFKNEDGDLVYIISDKDTIEYGLYETEPAVAEDGTEYEQINVTNDLAYGYCFYGDMSEGILVNDGTVYECRSLDESAGRDLVRMTIVGC